MTHPHDQPASPRTARFLRELEGPRGTASERTLQMLVATAVVLGVAFVFVTVSKVWAV